MILSGINGPLEKGKLSASHKDNNLSVWVAEVAEGWRPDYHCVPHSPAIRVFLEIHSKSKWPDCFQLLWIISLIILS